jgi:hypothetical protein
VGDVGQLNKSNARLQERVMARRLQSPARQRLNQDSGCDKSTAARRNETISHEEFFHA